jgi:hypothetical protein
MVAIALVLVFYREAKLTLGQRPRAGGRAMV